MSALEKFEADHVRPNPGRTLIVGSQVYGGKEDRRFRYADAVGVDMLPGPGVDVVQDFEDTRGAMALGLFDHVECMSVLEHCRRPWLMAASIEAVMREGATLFVSVPWTWRYHPYDHDYFRFSRDALVSLFPNIEWETLRYVTDRIVKGDTLASTKVNGHPYLARAETAGFGVKK